MTKRATFMAVVVAFLLLHVVAPAVAQPAKPEALPTGEAVLAKYVEASGGLAAFDAIKNRVTHATLQIPASGLTMKTTVYAARPDRLLTVVESDVIGKVESGVTDGVVWENSAIRGPIVKEGQERANTLRDATFERLVYWRTVFKSAECVGTDTVEGKRAFKVVMTPDSGSPLTLYFDADSGLLARAEWTYEGAEGKFPLVASFSDYRSVDGIKMAFTSKVSVAGQERTVAIERVEHNVDMPADRFALPAEIKALLKK